MATMKFNAAVLAVLLVVGISGPASANDCRVAGPSDYYTDKDFPDASDSNDGRYAADGGSGPFLTIQKLIDTVGSGECGFVRQSVVPYTELTRKSGTDHSGPTFTKGGTSENNRVVISGYPGEQPVIDQQRKRDANGRPVAAFYLDGGHYITIRNFEITGTTASGIFLASSGENNYIIVEENYIHHIYARENIGGVSLSDSNYAVVRNNIIHDIYDTRKSHIVNKIVFYNGECRLETVNTRMQTIRL